MFRNPPSKAYRGSPEENATASGPAGGVLSLSVIAVVGNILAALFLIWLTASLLRSRDPLWKFIGGVLAFGIVAVVLGVLYIIVKIVSH